MDFMITLLAVLLFCPFFGGWEQEHSVWFVLAGLKETPGIT